MAKLKTNLALGPGLIVLAWVVMSILVGFSFGLGTLPVALAIAALVLFYMGNEKIGLLLSLIAGILIVISAFADSHLDMIITLLKHLDAMDFETIVLMISIIVYIVGGVLSLISGLKFFKK